MRGCFLHEVIIRSRNDDLLFFDEKLSTFLRFGNNRLVAVKKGDRFQVVTQSLGISSFIFANNSHQIKSLPIIRAPRGISGDNVVGFSDDGRKPGFSVRKIFPGNSQTSQA